MGKIKKTIIISLVVVVTVLAIASLIAKIRKPTMGIDNNVVVPPITDQNNPDNAPVPDVKNSLSGEIVKMDMQEISIKDSNDDEVALKIPEKDVKFFKETKLNEGVTLKEIGLFDMKVGDKVEVEYNPETSNINFIKVLGE